MLSVDWYVEEMTLSDDFQGLSKFHEHSILSPEEGLGVRERETDRERKEKVTTRYAHSDRERILSVCL